ncbi:lipocalin-like domain-containing protein [Vreelandella aquamarina]
MTPLYQCLLLAAAGILLLSGCQEPQESNTIQGFAGLGADAQGYAQASATTPLTFPADHGPHPDYRIEWWYLTANLEDEQGAPLSLQWTLFRQALMPPEERPAPAPWAIDQVWMAHMGISRGATHVAAERFARSHSALEDGQAGVIAAPFQAWIDDWTFGTPVNHPPADNFTTFELMAYQGEGEQRNGYHLSLQAEGPLVLHGENGFNAKTVQGQGSHYYSQPFLRITGQVTLAGETRNVSGQGWLDREWSSQLLSAEQSGWDWFSLHLNDGRKLMAYQLRGGGEQGGDYTFAHLIKPDGSTQLKGAGQVTLTPQTTDTVAGREIPTRWTMHVPEGYLRLDIQARHPDRWMSTSVPYWEGDVVVRDAESQAALGVGYLEMTGY